MNGQLVWKQNRGPLVIDLRVLNKILDPLRIDIEFANNIGNDLVLQFESGKQFGKHFWSEVPDPSDQGISERVCPSLCFS